jgi:two-component system chemotaxis response regulator CheB
MNGIEFIRQLIPQHPLPVIVVSTISKAVFDAMEAGAVDFVVKPDAQSVKSVEYFINEMIVKVKIAFAAKVLQRKTGDYSHNISNNADAAYNDNIIAIGASTGGTEAILNILKFLPGNMPGIVIVQHIPPIFSRMFAERLNTSTNLEAKEAQTGDYVEKGRVLIAPGDYHMAVCRTGGGYTVQCKQGEKVNGHCPSVDVLFNSVAEHCGANSTGIILTGMGYDGAKGLLAMRKKGARTIGQDEQSSVVYGMPRVAFDIGAVEQQAALEKIPGMICSMLKGK